MVDHMVVAIEAEGRLTMVLLEHPKAMVLNMLVVVRMRARLVKQRMDHKANLKLKVECLSLW